jgi:hypothetical protein
MFLELKDLYFNKGHSLKKKKDRYKIIQNTIINIERFKKRKLHKREGMLIRRGILSTNIKQTIYDSIINYKQKNKYKSKKVFKNKKQ